MAISDITLKKTLPHSADAERAVLGAILLDNVLFDQAATILQIDDFHLQAHRIIFSSMAKLAAGQKPIDAVTLRSELKKRKTIFWRLEGPRTFLPCSMEFLDFPTLITMLILSKKKLSREN